MERDEHQLDVPRFIQPDDVTCGPTCLLQVLRFYRAELSLLQLLDRVPRNPDGGTLAVYLASTALSLGYRATLYPYNLRIFDPTWWTLPLDALEDKLRQREAVVTKPKLKASIQAHREFITAGGTYGFRELTPKLIMEILDRDHPILCGLSSTYLYRHPRESQIDMQADDVGGDPTGHFVAISGYSRGGRQFTVHDPSSHVPFSGEGRYNVPAQRLINSILLGVMTYDAVLLEIWPEQEDAAKETP